jgi:hypothetical protein
LILLLHLFLLLFLPILGIPPAPHPFLPVDPSLMLRLILLIWFSFFSSSRWICPHAAPNLAYLVPILFLFQLIQPSCCFQSCSSGSHHIPPPPLQPALLPVILLVLFLLLAFHRTSWSWSCFYTLLPFVAWKWTKIGISLLILYLKRPRLTMEVASHKFLYSWP